MACGRVGAASGGRRVEGCVLCIWLCWVADCVDGSYVGRPGRADTNAVQLVCWAGGRVGMAVVANMYAPQLSMVHVGPGRDLLVPMGCECRYAWPVSLLVPIM